MPKYQQFEDLPVWQEAARLYHSVLDFLEERSLAVSPGFRSQLDRAALSVSNNIAEGFERVSTNELISFLAIARGSAGEVRSMMGVIGSRPELKPQARHLSVIRSRAQSCSRQLNSWISSIEESPVQGKRHLTPQTRQAREASNAAQKFRLNFLRNLKMNHPLYNTAEARAARGEAIDE